MQQFVPICFLLVLGGDIAGAAIDAAQANPELAHSSSPTACTRVLAPQTGYTSDRFGFHFALPGGYVIQDATTEAVEETNSPLQVLQLWPQADFLNRMNLPEAPPLIRILVYDHDHQRPLADWKGELSHPDDRPLTVAGQLAIGYSSTGLYEADNVLLSSPKGDYIVRLQGSYLGIDDEIRSSFQTVVSSFEFCS